MNKKSDAPHIIFDAIHKVMSFEKGLKKNVKLIIDSPPFQRLKWIKQLGFLDMVFPAA